MATSNIKHSSLQYYRLQRNIVVSLVFFGLIVVIITASFALFIYPDSNLLQSISFFLLLFYGIGVLFARQILLSVNMYFHYFRMIEEDLPPFKVKNLPFSNSFHEHLISQDFHLVCQRAQFDVYFKLIKRMPFVRRTGVTLFWITQIKDNSVGFHDSVLEKELNDLKNNELKQLTYLNELSLIFKQTPQWEESQKQACQEIINFSFQNRAVIALPCAVISNTKLVYTLRPSRIFPNKYYYALINTLYTLVQKE